MNDVAVLKVRDSFKWAPNIQPVALINREVTSEELVTCGWGRTATSGPIPTNLKYLFTTTRPRNECQSEIYLNPDTFCTTSMLYLDQVILTHQL